MVKLLILMFHNVCCNHSCSNHVSSFKHGEYYLSTISQHGEITKFSIAQCGEITTSRNSQHGEITKSIAQHYEIT